MSAKYAMTEMTWPELRAAVQEGRIAVMPVGTIEQHGPHLPLDTDICLAQEITTRAAALTRERVVLVPPIVHGHSPHHMDFPGTLNVEAQHLLNYVLDVCLSLTHHGFEKLLLVNGHGSNAPILDLVARQTIIRTQGRAACASIFYMQSPEWEGVAREAFPGLGNWSGHADAIETSMYMAIRPGSVALNEAQDDPWEGPMDLGTARLPLRLWWSSLSKQGIYGKVSDASELKGKQLVTAAVEGLAKIFVDFHARVIPKRVDHH